MTWKQHLPKSALAAAVMMCVAGPPAVADGNDHSSNIQVGIDKAMATHKHVDYFGWVEISGDIETDSMASATVDSVQKTDGNEGPLLPGADAGEVSVGGDALRDARGNIGLNTAAGSNNAQSNSMAVAATDEEFVFGDGQANVFAQQQSSGNRSTSDERPTTVAAAHGNALRGVQGNVGANIAGGRNNAQQNNVALSSGSHVMGSATVATDQKAKDNSPANYPFREPAAQASLSGNVLLEARGNIGVNVASGSNNLQANNLALTSASK